MSHPGEPAADRIGTRQRAYIASSLGVTMTDLLGWYLQILFVEGAHDEAVIEALLCDVLDETRTLVIPIRGVKDSANIVDARLIDYTDARVFLLPDSLGASSPPNGSRRRPSSKPAD